MILVSLRVALRAFARNPLRTGLTMLGLVIGVGAVVTMVALGNGAGQNVHDNVQSAGTNLVHVNAGNFTRGGEESKIATGLGSATTLSTADADAIAREVPGIKHSAAGVRFRGWMVAGDRRSYGQVIGTDVVWPAIYGWSFERGRFFSANQVGGREAVAVLGRTVRDRLFGEGVNPVGREIRIRDRAFKIVGVSNSQDEDQLEMAVVPYTALQDLLGIPYLHTITIAAEQAGDATRLVGDITALLRERHKPHTDAAVSRLRSSGLGGNQMPNGGTGLTPDDFTVKSQAAEALTKGLYTSVAAFILANMPKLDEVNMGEMASTLQQAGTTMTALLAGIAAISLIVGGIGIMNIMLVSVTERTREIGLRRAVGARARDVRLQFLVEAVALSVVGGVLGILLGFGASAVLTRLLEWPTAFSISAVLLAFSTAGAVGVFFGFYPAQRASRLHPIDALRTE